MLKTPVILGISTVSRKNRRWIVAFIYAIVAFLIANFALIHPAENRFIFVACGIGAVISRWIFGRLVKERVFSEISIGQMTNLDLSPGRRDRSGLDERERALSNWAHYEAFRVLAFCSFFVWLFAYVAVPELLVLNPPIVIRVFEGISMALLVLAFTLPQAILLWTQPDVPEEVRV